MHNSRILMTILLAFLLTGMAGVCTACTYPEPVQTIQPPENLTIAVQVDQEGSNVIATFRGGFGQMLLKDIQLQLIRPDSTCENKTLGKNVGDSVTFSGTGCSDQILGWATFMNGIRYPFLNQMLRYIPGICHADYSVSVDPCAEIAASSFLIPEPVTEIPANKTISIQANVDIRTINVEFRGGFGQGLVKSIMVTRYTPDGRSEMQYLDNRVGAEVSFDASNNCLDRIAADVQFMDGNTYHFFDTVLHISRAN
jgi:hypothetical protein